MFCDILVMLIVAEAIMSWFVSAMPYQLRRIYELLGTLTEPFIRPFRRLTERFAYSSGIDIAPLIAVIVIQGIGRGLSYFIAFLI